MDNYNRNSDNSQNENVEDQNHQIANKKCCSNNSRKRDRNRESLLVNELINTNDNTNISIIVPTDTIKILDSSNNFQQNCEKKSTKSEMTSSQQIRSIDLILFIVPFLNLKDISKVDRSFTNHCIRKVWLELPKQLGSNLIVNIKSSSNVEWCIKKNIYINKLCLHFLINKERKLDPLFEVDWIEERDLIKSW